ncbi:MAG: hypothetical protein ACHBMF_07065 [Chromatiales bacterium]
MRRSNWIHAARRGESSRTTHGRPLAGAEIVLVGAREGHQRANPKLRPLGLEQEDVEEIDVADPRGGRSPFAYAVDIVGN